MPELTPYTPERESVGEFLARSRDWARTTAARFRQQLYFFQHRRAYRSAQESLNREQELRHKPRAVRSLDFDTDMPQRQGEFVAGATNVVQRSYKKFRSGKKPKKNARLALRMIEASQSSAIQRYQRIGAYETFNNVFDGVGSLSCGHEQITIGRTVGGSPKAEIANAYPVHLFDLTSGNFYSPGIPIEDTATTRIGRYQYAPCHWRLVAYQTGTPVGSIGDFYWLPESGQTAQNTVASPAFHWQTERNNASVVTNTVALPRAGAVSPFMSDKCYYNWADIRMALYGARKQTTRFTVSLVQITDRVYDPRKFRRVGTADAGFVGNSDGPYNVWYDSVKSEEEQRNFNAAMQEFVQPLIFHPMHSAGATKITPFKTLLSKRFVIGPDTSSNEDEGQPNVLMKFFKRLNRMVNYAWDDIPSIVNDADLDSAEFNQFVQTQVKGYAHPRAKLYVMVTAQAFTEVGGSTEVPMTADNTPGLDVIIRRKVTYDHVTRPAPMPAS